MRTTPRLQGGPPPAHAEQRERAARLRDAAGRFAREQAEAPSAPQPETVAAAPPHGTVPAPADAHPDAYGLLVDENGLGLHAPPGASVLVEPVAPKGAGLAVFQSAQARGPGIFDLPHTFNPNFAKPFGLGSEVMPLVEVVDPITGRCGRIRADKFDAIHRVIGIYVPAEVATKHRIAPAPLPVMRACPEGMGEHYVDDTVAYPLVRSGETVIYDPSRRELTPGALCVLQWNNGTRDVMLTNQRTVGRIEGRWWVDPVNRPANRAALERQASSGPVGMLHMSDGPYEADHLREKIVGTVVGVLVPDSQPTEPTSAPETETAQPDTADGIYAAAERERDAAEAVALDDANLTSAVSAGVRAAIIRHGEVMRATVLRQGETDEEFSRTAQLQDDAERAVARAPAQSLADLRAKLTYLLPLMADTIGDEMHAEHLDAIRDDADRLCREAARAPEREADPVFAAIHAHAEARTAFEETSNPADTVWRQEQGLDTSPEAVAAAVAIYEAASSKEFDVWNAMFTVRPTTLAGLAALARHAQKWAAANDGGGALSTEDMLGVIAADVERLAPPPPADAPTETDDEVQARLAATPFVPADINGPCPVPSREQWIADADTSLRWLRLGFAILTASREDLTGLLRGQSGEEFSDMLGGLGVAQRNLAQMGRLAEDALNRVIIGAAILAEEERLAGSGGEV